MKRARMSREKKQAPPVAPLIESGTVQELGFSLRVHKSELAL